MSGLQMKLQTGLADGYVGCIGTAVISGVGRVYSFSIKELDRSS